MTSRTRHAPKPKYVPKHRTQHAKSHALVKPAKLAKTVVLSSLAVGATGVAVTGGVLGGQPALVTEGATSHSDAAAQSLHSAADHPLSKADLRDRGDIVSRSDRRDRTDAAKEAALSTTNGVSRTHSESIADADPRTIAKALLPQYGFSAADFGCLDSLYMSESGWRVNADNPTSSAYGIPQALTSGRDMPPGYFSSAEVQIKWGLDYIRESYGSPCSAWNFKSSHGWY